MAAGGTLNLTAAGLQSIGGVAQVMGDAYSDAGWANIKYGSINALFSLTMVQAARAWSFAGTTVSQRLFNSELQGGLAGGGLLGDGITYVSPDFAPRQARCGAVSEDVSK